MKHEKEIIKCMKHEKEIIKCQRRAESSLAQADFIKERCQGISMVCVHSPYEDMKTGQTLACIHVYSRREARAEFGDDCWVDEKTGTDSDAVRHQKFVGQLLVSYDPDHD